MPVSDDLIAVVYFLRTHIAGIMRCDILPCKQQDDHVDQRSHLTKELQNAEISCIYARSEAPGAVCHFNATCVTGTDAFSSPPVLSHFLPIHDLESFLLSRETSAWWTDLLVWFQIYFASVEESPVLTESLLGFSGVVARGTPARKVPQALICLHGGTWQGHACSCGLSYSDSIC